ncbi:hypothetical protein PHYC_03059 [Phycisphaerales bacterium]|nr:hypothetical protein PHYC_03059 [Phycisphaerales bacterium]
MKDRSWFRLALRAIGLVMLGLSVPRLVALLASVVSTFVEYQGTWPPGYGMSYLLAAAESLVQGGFGVYLLFFADGLIRLCLRDLGVRCDNCQYSLVGVAGDRCPECGCEFKRPNESRADKPVVGPADPAN